MIICISGHDHAHHHDHEQHNQAVWLGFVALVSMIGFFVFEKIINIIGEMREKHNDDRKEAFRKIDIKYLSAQLQDISISTYNLYQTE